MPAVNNPCRRLLDTVKNIFFSRTLRVVLVFLLLVSSCTTLAALPVFLNFLSPLGTIVLSVFNGVIAFHHWFGMIL
jgi:hypothetical protein